MPKRVSTSEKTRLAAVEENLSDFDIFELQKGRERIANSEACFESVKVAKEEIGKLTREKAGLQKKAPDFKEKSRDIAKRIEVFEGVAQKNCRLRQPGCIPSVDAKRIMVPKTIANEINERNGTRIDFEKLIELEGGDHTVAYIPWWPYIKNDKPLIKYYSESSDPNLPRLAGAMGADPINKSGATVGVGVDLGQFTAIDFLKKMKRWNKGENMISDEEIGALYKKITPYFQLIGGEACKFLREHPLELTPGQINFLDNVSQNDALEKTIRLYKDRTKNMAAKNFQDLTVEQQTSLLSNTYQYGSAKDELVRAIVEGKRSIIPDIRERKYLFNSMPKEEI